MDGADIGVLHEFHQIIFRGFLKSCYCSRLHSIGGAVILKDFPDHPLEWEFEDEEFMTLEPLEVSDLGQGTGSGLLSEVPTSLVD